MKLFWLSIAIALAVAAAPVCLRAEAHFSPGPKRILILNSYNQRFNWVDNIQRGIEKGIAERGYDVWYDYLDTKNLSADFPMELYAPLLQRKYAGVAFDMVVTVDDPAYQFFIRYRHEIFHDAAALAIGLNGVAYPREDRTSYLVENPDYRRTLDLALDQNPRAKAIHIVLDKTLTGERIKRSIAEAWKGRPLAIDWIDQGTSVELAARVGTIAPGDILAYAVYFNPVDGYVSNDRVFQTVAAAARVPVYTFWSFNINFGAFGGYAYDGYRLGLESAEIIRNTVELGMGPVYRDDPYCEWVFDWRQVQAHRLGAYEFPLGTRFINKPEQVVVLDLGAVVLFAAAFALAIAFIVLVLIAHRSQRNLLTYKEQQIAAQRELMLNLGNVIENRSQETASHVERITAMGLFIADRLGLSAELRLELETGAPMHDIGKVGIPDSILNKPGPLSAEEFEIMKTHTSLGYSIFKTSQNPTIQAAARIALEHHERWDGNGYPAGKRGRDIDLLARIVAVCDVTDALLSERVYKAAWEPERVVAFLREHAGTIFDPELANLVLDDWPAFYAVFLAMNGFKA